MAAEKQRLLKLTILAYRKPGMTEDEFHQHWTVHHPAVVGDWLIKHGIVRYTQYHTPSATRMEAAAQLTTFGSMASEAMADYDGFVELVMPTAQCFDNARKDPYYESTVKPDEDKFADMARSKIIVGWEEVHIQDGKIVATT